MNQVAASPELIFLADDLLENLRAVGVTVARRKRTLILSPAHCLTSALRAAIERNFRAVMYVVRAREQTLVLLRRFRCEHERQTAPRLACRRRADPRRQSEPKRGLP